jgi:hypothetical protein
MKYLVRKVNIVWHIVGMPSREGGERDEKGKGEESEGLSVDGSMPCSRVSEEEEKTITSD